MEKSVLKILLTLFVLACFSSVQGQQSIVTGGGDARGTNGSSSFSIGQWMIGLDEGPNGTVSYGVQQPIEISTITGIDDCAGINLTCSAYPNPVIDLLILEIPDGRFSNLQMTLYNSTGTMLEQKNVEAEKSEIAMGNRMAGIYILTVTSEQNNIKSFKIIKN